MTEDNSQGTLTFTHTTHRAADLHPLNIDESEIYERPLPMNSTTSKQAEYKELMKQLHEEIED